MVKRQVRCPRCGFTFEVLSKRSPGMGAQEGVHAKGLGTVKKLVLYALWSNRALEPNKAMSNYQIWYWIHDEMLKRNFKRNQVPRFNTVQGRVSDLLGAGMIKACPESVRMGYNVDDGHVVSRERLYYYLTVKSADLISTIEDKYFWVDIARARSRGASRSLASY